MARKKEGPPNQQAKQKFSLRHPHPDYNNLCVEISPIARKDKPGKPTKQVVEQPKTDEQLAQNILEMCEYLRIHNIQEIEFRPVSYDDPDGQHSLWVVICHGAEKRLRTQANRKGFYVYTWRNSRTIPPRFL